ncbi:MAG: hypothetical protein QOC64_2605 [Solirubrobacteraceae bacterium]|jgi:hypothetical protein|nr:hypothetical protein [Solirubrobacteraceae bacterium]
MRPLLAVLVAAATCLACATPATATAAPGTLVASPLFVPEAGPLLAGDAGVVWLRRRDDAVLDLWEADAASARHVQRFVAADGERLRVMRLTTSSTQVALELREGDERRTYAGAFGGPLVAASPPALPVLPALPALPAGVPGVRFTDADEHRAVWVARGCRSAQIRIVALPLATATAITQREPTCRLRLRERARLRGDRLRFGLSCAGLRIDCAARVVVRAGGRVIARGGASYNHATPPFAAVNLRVTAAGLRLLRRNPGARVRISARFGELARRRATVVVVRRSRVE